MKNALKNLKYRPKPFWRGGYGLSLTRSLAGLALAALLAVFLAVFLAGPEFFWPRVTPKSDVISDNAALGPTPAARPNPYDRGTCYQWKGCRGESIGAMPVEDPAFCGPLGGKSWKDFNGRCHNLREGPYSADPPEDVNRSAK